MSDEEFDAFLRGEDDLSRRLQGLNQPASSPKLDAAILGYVKAGLAQEEQEARPAAANDPVIEGAPPRLAPGPGRRWRIPAGIAAGVLAGVLGHQVYQENGARMEHDMAAAQVVPAAEQPAPAVLEPREMNVLAEAAQPSPPPVVVAKADRVDMPADSRASAAPAPKPTPMPPPAPSPVEAAAAPPAPEPARVEITGSAVKRERVSGAPANVADERLAAAAPQADQPVVAEKADTAVSYARAARMARPHPLARAAAEKLAESKPDSADTPEMRAKRARDWLSVIDAMLKADMNSEALAEWSKFRTAYPDYPVADQMLARIAAIKR